ncbi:MAG: LptE family protein [Planctomycetes bacterium]|nr:LptE family protein [Planctomycetota bacterium]
MYLRRASFACAMLVLSAFVMGGCNYSTRSGLPEHIRTVQVPVFKNTKTLYKGLETKLTAGIIEQLQNDPQVRVVNSGGNATIDGEITKVERKVYLETKDDQPASVRVSITVRVTFYDEVEQRPIIKDLVLNSSQSSSVSGLYEVDRGELQSAADDSAIKELSKEIVRQTIAMW